MSELIKHDCDFMDNILSFHYFLLKIFSPFMTKLIPHERTVLKLIRGVNSETPIHHNFDDKQTGFGMRCTVRASD